MLWKIFLFWNVFLLVNLVDSYSKRKPKDGKREKVEKVVRKSESRGKKNDIFIILLILFSL